MEVEEGQVFELTGPALVVRAKGGKLQLRVALGSGRGPDGPLLAETAHDLRIWWRKWQREIDKHRRNRDNPG